MTLACLLEIKTVNICSIMIGFHILPIKGEPAEHETPFIYNVSGRT